MASQSKKILILGANTETIELVKTARELNLFVCVCSPCSEDPAKQFADLSIEVDCKDVDVLFEKVKHLDLDGVLVGVADPLIISASKLSKKLGLPEMVSEKTLNILTNKAEFENKILNFGLAAVEKFSPNDVKKGKIKFPIVVKPVDANSGKGITICNDFSQFEAGVMKARKASASAKCFVEPLMSGEDISISYTIINGVVFLSAIGDRFKNLGGQHNQTVCRGIYYPSKVTKEYLERANSAFLDFLQSLQIKNGVFTVGAFFDGTEFRFYDPGFRLQGEGVDKFILEATSFNQREFLIKAALGLPEGSNKAQENILPSISNTQSIKALSVWILMKPGTIKKIEGIENFNARQDVFFIQQRKYVGDYIEKSDLETERAVFARIFVKVYNRSEIIDLVKYFYNTLIVLDDQNTNLLDLNKTFSISRVWR